MSFSATPVPTHVDTKSDSALANPATVGRIFFGAGIFASGIQQITLLEFVRLVPKLPAWVPWHPFWACLVGALLILIGIEIVLEKRVRLAALVFSLLLLLCLVCGHLPGAFADPLKGFMWTNSFKILALCGGAVALAGSSSARAAIATSDSEDRAAKWGLLSRVLLALFLLVAGIQHFVYVDFVVTLVPKYFSGSAFWAYFTGVALFLGGAGLLLRQTARLAALLSGIMILLWVLLLHIPRALADVHQAGETSAIFEALAISGVAFLIAGLLSQKAASLEG